MKEHQYQKIMEHNKSLEKLHDMPLKIYTIEEISAVPLHMKATFVWQIQGLNYHCSTPGEQDSSRATARSNNPRHS